MIELTNTHSEICVIGRIDFSTGIGAVSYSACELLSRHFPISIYPTNSGAISTEYVELPNGRKIPVCKNLDRNKVFFYTDVLWNGDYDLNYTLIPQHGLRIAQIAYDSDELPAKWVEILNNSFDIAYFTSHHLEDVAIKCGVNIPVGTLPVGLELEHLLTRPLKTSRNKVRFGSIAAFHQRKGVDILVDAFIQEFNDDENVELLIHSNLAIGDVYNKIVSEIKERRIKNIILSHKDLDVTAKTNLLDTIDIFINCSRGEGYSIGPREALALGKTLVLSDIGPHRDLFGLPGTFAIPATINLPARYPEINNQVFGRQQSVTISAVREKLRQAYDFFRSADLTSTAHQRRERAAEFSFHKLAKSYAETLTPDIASFKKCSKSSQYPNITEACKKAATNRLGQFGSELSAKNRIVLPAHDGGFFSVFNTFMSHLVWDINEDRCHLVLPDWDVGRLLEKQRDKKLISFCYGRPQDGNIWLNLFKPLYGLSEKQMNDEEFLYKKSSLPETIFNEHREPLLTYVHAYDLYKSPSFKAFRRQYHKIFTTHVQLLPHFQQEIDQFSEVHLKNKYMIAAHVKHPSHMIEQPGMCIAHGQSFIDAIRQKVLDEEIPLESENWGVFLATDQDRVVAQFKDAFGDRVRFFDDVRRTKISEDEFYDNLPEHEKAKEGFQVQHLVAATPENWSTRMAWEVIRDAMVMSRCSVLFHIVSNVSTAVSYFNPDIELNFVQS